MADRDPAEQQLDTSRTDQAADAPDKANAGREDSIDKTVENHSVVKPDDYPEKARYKD